MVRAVVILFVLMVGGVAGAQPTDAEQERAREHFARAEKHYNLGEFEQAIEHYKKSYELSEAPELLFNIAQAHRLAGHIDEAIYFYDSYLRLKKDAANRADVEAFLKGLRRQKAAADEAARRKKQEREAAADAAARERQAGQGAIVSPPAEHDGESKRGGWAVASLVVGVAGLTAGGVLHWKAFQIQDELKSGVMEPRYGDLVSQLHTRERLAWIAYGAGAGAIGLGVYLLVGKDEREPGISVSLGDGASVVYSASF
jgi:tetratricopeptide (TPR) repeat protein